MGIHDSQIPVNTIRSDSKAVLFFVERCTQWLIPPARESGNEGSANLEQHTYVVLK